MRSCYQESPSPPPSEDRTSATRSSDLFLVRIEPHLDRVQKIGHPGVGLVQDVFNMAAKVTAPDVWGWSDTASIAFRLARTWARYGIRGKGWLARLVGRKLRRYVKCTVRSEHSAKIACFPGSLDPYAGTGAAGGRYKPQVIAVYAGLLRVGDVLFRYSRERGPI